MSLDVLKVWTVERWGQPGETGRQRRPGAKCGEEPLTVIRHLLDDEDNVRAELWFIYGSIARESSGGHNQWWILSSTRDMFVVCWLLSLQHFILLDIRSYWSYVMFYMWPFRNKHVWQKIKNWKFFYFSSTNLWIVLKSNFCVRSQNLLRLKNIWPLTRCQQLCHLSGSRPVPVLAQPDALPRAQVQLPVRHRHRQVGPEEASLHVRRLQR